MAHEDVVHNQRMRIQGGLIESVARRGYNRTAVRHIIAYAGVSRRAFYEQFKSKEDCFLATFDLVAKRLVVHVAHACSSTKDLEKRLGIALRVLVDELETTPKTLRLVLVDALTAGGRAEIRLCGLLLAAERALQNTACRPEMVVGGVYRVLFARLRAGRLERTLYERMLGWALVLASPEMRKLRPRLGRAPPWPKSPQMSLTGASERARLEESAINLALRSSELSGIEIASEAGVSLDAFLDLYLYLDPDECLQAALDTQGQKLLESVADPSLVSGDWPTAVRQAVSRCTTHLATNPAYTTILGTGAYGGRLESIERMLLLGDEVATLLTEGAPSRQGMLTPELISGALARTLRTEVLAGRGHQLQRLDGHLAYMVLAPYEKADRRS